MSNANKPVEEWSIFSRRQKLIIIVLVTWGGFFSPLSAAIYLPAIQTLAHDLHRTTSQINLTITTYMIFQGLAPTFFGVLADQLGKRPVYLVTFTIYIAANIGLALQSNYVALLVLRCIQSTGSSATIALAIGTAGDLARGSERGKYIGWTASGFLLGPAIGPIIGGLLAGKLSWRAIFWFLVIMAVVFISVYAMFCIETTRSIVGNGSIPAPRLNKTGLQLLTERRANRRQRETVSDVEANVEPRCDNSQPGSVKDESDLEKSEAKRTPENEEDRDPALDKEILHREAAHSAHDLEGTPTNDIRDTPKKEPQQAAAKRKFVIPNPMKSLILLTEIDFAIILLYSALVFAAGYQLMASTVTIFKDLYGYNDITIGLCYMPFGFATMLGTIIGGRLVDWNMRRLSRHGNFALDQPFESAEGQAFPWEKARLQIVFPGTMLMVLFLIAYGWSVQRHITVAVPLVLQFFASFGMTISTNSFSVMLVDRYPSKSATASAASNFTRCLLGAGGVAVIQPMLTAMGRGPCFSFVGGVLLLFSPVLWILMKNGPKWREQRLLRETNR